MSVKDGWWSPFHQHSTLWYLFSWVHKYWWLDLCGLLIFLLRCYFIWSIKGFIGNLLILMPKFHIFYCLLSGCFPYSASHSSGLLSQISICWCYHLSLYRSNFVMTILIKICLFSFEQLNLQIMYLYCLNFDAFWDLGFLCKAFW